MRIDKASDFNHPPLSFHELDEGFSPREAIAEAKRCLNCSRPLCRTGCPIENEIPQFIHALSEGNIGEASAIIARRSNLPAVCGRVCPHERQCEAHCVLNKKGCGIRVGKLERFVADFAAEMDLYPLPPQTDKARGRVAVIGSGPAGLTVAGDLAKAGFAVTVFEAQAEPGGVLMYGIPAFRLNKEVVRREIRTIARYGVTFKTGVLVGPDITIDDMFAQGFDAIFIGTGTALPRTMNIPGEDLPGVVPATYLLQMTALVSAGKVARQEIPVSLGDRVVVVGGGNVAIDAARTALRVGAGRVTVVYRRTERELPALKSEYEYAKKEGAVFRWLLSPTQVVGSERVTGLECEHQEQTDAGLRGTGEREIIPADKVIVAIGQRPAARIVSTTTGIETNPRGYVITRQRPYGMTTRRGVFAGGDVVHEPATVVLAMKEAKKVAAGIAMYVDAKKLLEEC